MINSTVMKAELLAFWRYERQAPVVGVELFEQDVMAVTKSRKIVVCEIKVSTSDLRADGSKEFHFRAAQMLGIKREAKNYKEARMQLKAVWVRKDWMPNQFYFAVPYELEAKAKEIIEQRYPYAGLIVVRHFPEQQMWGHSIYVARPAVMLHTEKASIKFISMLVKSMTSSLASAYKLVVRAQGKESLPGTSENVVS